MDMDEGVRESIRKKYAIPSDKTVFVYGGNLGKPQGISFLMPAYNPADGLENWES